MNIRLIELFGGVGCQARALERMGVTFEHYRMIEFDKYPIASYNAIHGTDFVPTDIRDISGADLGVTDTENNLYIMTYSFPCQDISVAGKTAGYTKGSGTRSGLLWEVERLLNEMETRPQILLMENVPNVHGKKNLDNWNLWLRTLEDLGYHSKWADLNAKDYGIAQNRKRTFCVSFLDENAWMRFQFPEPIPLTTTMDDYLDDDVDEKYYIKSNRAADLITKLIDEGKVDLNEVSHHAG